MKTSSRVPLFALLLAGAAALLWWMFRADPVQDEDPDVAAAQMGAQGRSDGGGDAKSKLRRQSALELHEAPKASVSGIVRTQGGRPLGGARVCAFMAGDETERPRVAPCVASTLDGRFRLEGLLAARYDVTAAAAGHVPGRYAPEGKAPQDLRLAAGQQRTGVDISLQPGGVEVFGTVRDISGGEIAGAQIHYGSRWAFFGASSPPTTVLSNEEGAFSVWVEPGNVSLSADAEGYASEDQRGLAPGTHFDLFLTPEAVVVGRVVDVATGDAVAGARVSVQRSPAVLSAEDGTFRIEGLAPGVYKPTVKADAGYGEAETSVHLGLGETSEEVVVHIHPAATVAGVVVIKTGEDTRPCEDGSARLTPVPNVGSNMYWGSVEVEGEVRMQGVLPGRYEVTASCTGHVSEDSYGEIEVSDASVEGLRWEVEPGASIRGRVLVADASQLRGLSVMARSSGGEARGKSGWARTTEFGEDGSFVLEGLSPNTYDVQAQGALVPSVEEPLSVEVPQGEVVDGIELELQPEAIIRGRVQDEAGNPVSSAQIRAEGPGQNWSSDQVGDDGRFELRGLRGGEYRVQADLNWSDALRKPGTNDDDVQGEAVTVEAGGEAEVLLVVEARNASISGRVLDDAGGPIADAFVRAERASDSQAANAKNSLRQARWGGWNEQPIMTDTEGGFTLEGLSEGSYTVWAVRKGGGEGYAENIAAGSGGVTVELQPTGRMEGTVVSSSGAAPQRFEIRLRDDTTGFSRRESFFATDGRFEFEELPPGTFFISATSADGSGDTEVTLAKGASQTGVKVELQQMVAVKGRVVDLETGEPVAGINVSMGRKKSGGFNFRLGGGDKRNITDDSGNYELDAVPVGPVSVTLMPKDFSDDGDYTYAQSNTVIQDGSPFEVPALTMVKRRVKKSEDAGDLGYTLKESEPGVEWSERELVVGFVRPGGPAAAAGLEIGAKIESVDGHDVTADASRYHTLSSVEVGATVELGVAGGSSVKITAAKKP